MYCEVQHKFDAVNSPTVNVFTHGFWGVWMPWSLPTIKFWIFFSILSGYFDVTSAYAVWLVPKPLSLGTSLSSGLHLRRHYFYLAGNILKILPINLKFPYIIKLEDGSAYSFSYSDQQLKYRKLSWKFAHTSFVVNFFFFFFRLHYCEFLEISL